ncbi:MAG TPA: Eco29kI family restriction endonuclease, partial [Terriglobia bacterium]|nr:Eco29kI family restriction endonuclease [Terriglobia bacterium]
MVAALLKQPVKPLGSLAPFEGAGVYAIYYRGEFEPYRPVSTENRRKWKRPIYVGKAAGKGTRKGGFVTERSPGRAMFERLKQHSQSIREARNLDLEHFECRYLVTEEVFIPLCESLLIDRYKPI